LSEYQHAYKLPTVSSNSSGNATSSFFFRVILVMLFLSYQRPQRELCMCKMRGRTMLTFYDDVGVPPTYHSKAFE
jgi:hypothetical protein